MNRSALQDAAQSLDALECPRCRSLMQRLGADEPVIDAAGFAIYHVRCAQCGYDRSGVIDPSDGTLC